MPKDAYAMWNKLNKSIIGLTAGGDMLDCTSCGECAAVCPVGALINTDYMYTSNSWELNRVPSTCAHCSAGCQINYDVKHESIENPEDKIYRVTNEWNYVSLCGAGRYSYDYENKNVTKDEVAFANALTAFEKADTIKFTSTITNEEAHILQTLKETKGYKLINTEAKAFQDFLKDYSEISGTVVYGSDLKVAHDSNFIVSVGTALKTDNPNARYAFNNSMTMNKGAGLYFHPVSDPVVNQMSKSVMSIKHAPLQEEAALYLLLDLFAKKEDLPSSVVDYLASFHSKKMITVTETIKEKVIEIVKEMKVNEETGLEEEVEVEKSKMVPKKVEKEVEVDENALLALLNAPEDFEEKMEKFLKKKDAFSLIVGPDLYTHPASKNLARLCALIEKYTEFELVMIPTLTNSLGVSQICDLDDEAGTYSIGYNTEADFVLSALGEGDLDMPAMNQQEGTMTSINKRVNPTNAALGYGGYVLNDLANALGMKADLTIEYTEALSTEKGFKTEKFDDLDNYYENDGTEKRGYVLDVVKVATGSDENVEAFNDTKIEKALYLANPVRQFSDFTAKAHQSKEKPGLHASGSYLEANGLSIGDKVKVTTAKGTLEVEVSHDHFIDGEIAYLTTFDSKLKSEALFDGYRFTSASIERV